MSVRSTTPKPQPQPSGGDQSAQNPPVQKPTKSQPSDAHFDPVTGPTPFGSGTSGMWAFRSRTTLAAR